jgi:putative holliday junction resolvase
MADNNDTLLALDVGGRRIGVATANVVARIARPLTTIQNNQDTPVALQRLIDEQQAIALVVGLPRSLNGEDTEQTRTIRGFVDLLKTRMTR